MPSEKKSLGFHPFAKKVIDGATARLDLIQTLKDSMKEGKGRSVKRKKLWQWEHERYEYEVLIHLAAIMAAMERLEQGQSFIRTFPQPRSYEKKGIT